MLSIPSSIRIFLCLQPADMRRSFDGLRRMTEDCLGEDPFSCHLFVFRNRRGDRMKILYWDRDGFALWYKRLEAGAFAFPAGDGARAEVSAAQLSMILEGIDLSAVKRAKRYARS